MVFIVGWVNTYIAVQKWGISRYIRVYPLMALFLGRVMRDYTFVKPQVQTNPVVRTGGCRYPGCDKQGLHQKNDVVSPLLNTLALETRWDKCWVWLGFMPRIIPWSPIFWDGSANVSNTPQVL